MRLLVFFIGIVMLFINIIFRDDYTQFACLSVCLSVYGPLDDAVTLPFDSGTDLGIDTDQLHLLPALYHIPNKFVPHIQLVFCPPVGESQLCFLALLYIRCKLIPYLRLTRLLILTYLKRCYPGVFLLHLFT